MGQRFSRRAGLLAAAGLMLAGLLSAAPVSAAPGCSGTSCVTYYADLTITVSTSPLPVFPGDVHYYTVRVTNTGWRVGGSTAPHPAPGPDSGRVYVVVMPNQPEELGVYAHSDSGGFHCAGYHGQGLACDTLSIPTGATAQLTVGFRVSRTPGWYDATVFADSYGWTEYNENNNTTTVPYEVGYLA